MKAFLAALLVSGFVTSTTAAAEEPSVQDLDALIGTWEFSDEATELAGFTYREEGRSTCRYDLDDTHIRCDSVATYNDKDRHYVTYISYNDIAETFEMISLFGNFPEKSSFTLRPSDDFTRLELIGDPMRQRNGTLSRNYGVITFSGPDSFTWETRLNRSHEAPNHWPLKFIGQYRKVAD